MIIDLAIIILLLPLASFAIQIFVGKRLPRQGDWLPTGAMFTALALALVEFFLVRGQHNPAFSMTRQWTWMDFGPVQVSFGILVDNLTAIMLVVVTLVSALVHLYSIGYMSGDNRYSRYFAFLSLFSFSMLGIVLVDNLLGMYVFWELVGLSSYLLIGFWFERKSASDAGKKAFLVNRVGDIGMFMGIMIIFASLGTLNFEAVFTAVANGQLSGTLLTAAGVLIFCGAIGKSAQFPLHVWLPDAMEGPTPVSALIHAATMVAAGVYLVGRTFLLYSPDALLIIAYIGTITATMAATIAIVQMDIKRVLAYSTVSQLGYMVAALGVGGYTSGLFHLTTHAAFKALLFLGAGSVIHAMHHEQDMPNMGGLRKKMPITFYTMLAATLAISGVPFFSGFYSKDAILAAALAFGMSAENPMHMTIFVALLASAAITSFYMFRLLFMTFFGEPRDKEKFDHAHESPRVMTIPLIVLAVLSVALGWGGWFEGMIAKPDLSAFATGAGHGLAAHTGGHGDHHAAHNIALVLSIAAAGLGILISWLVYMKKAISAERMAERMRPVYNLLWNKYYVDELYHATVIKATLLIARASALFDMKAIDGVVNGMASAMRRIAFAEGAFDNSVVDGLVNLVGNTIRYMGGILRGIQTGRVQNYVMLALGGVVVIFILGLL